MSLQMHDIDADDEAIGMTGIADLAAEVAALQAEVADLRAALRHARDLAAHERRGMRAAAEDAAGACVTL